MAAIITTPFRVLNAENFKSDVGTSSVYLGIGKSDVWSTSTSDVTDTIPFTPGDHQDDINDAWSQMIGLKKIASSDISHVVPRYDYADGESYVAWDSSDPDIYDEKFYVLTSAFKVYKCIQKGPGNTSVEPTHTGAAILPTRSDAASGDGYRWKYMYTITTADSEKFLTKSFMPVKTLAMAPDLPNTDVNRAQQKSQQDSRDLATAAGIERIVIENGGSGYDAADDFTVEIQGDFSTQATVVDAGVTVNAGTGAITDIAINAEGADYTKAKVIVTHDNDSGGTAGSGCVARAVLAPSLGHGVDPVRELGAFFISVNTQLDGASGDLTTGNDFRQITLIKDPYSTGTTVATADVLMPMKYLQLAGGASMSGFTVDDVISGGSGSNLAQAFLVRIDSSNKRLYYYQNQKTGFRPFANSMTITGASGGSAALATSHIGAAEAVAGSGQVVFLENRDPISRSTTQIEDIKCIVEF